MVSISPIKIRNLLVNCSIALILASLVIEYLQFGLNIKSGYGTVRLFRLDSEDNIPTWFSSVLLLFNALLLFLISGQPLPLVKRFRNHWLVLGVLFLFVSIDEFTQLHEALSRFRETLGSGLFYFPWVIPGSVLILLVSIFYLRFVLALPPRYLRLFIISGVLYVGGALIIEVLSGYYANTNGQFNLIYFLMTDLEESLELIGLVIFNYALLTFVGNELPESSITFQKQS